MMFLNYNQNKDSNSSPDNSPDSRIVAWFCTVMIALSAGICYSFGVFFTSMQNEFLWDRSETAGIFSIFLLVAAAIAPVALWASNKFGPRLVILILGVIIGLGLLLTSLSGSSWQIYLNYSIVLALGIGGTVSVAIYTISKWFTREQTVFLVIIGVGLGIVVLAPVSGWLISSYDWKDACLILGIIAWLITIQPALFLKDHVRGESVDNSSDPVTDISSRNFRMVVLLLLFLSFSLHMMTAHLIPWAIDQGISISTASLLLSILGGMTFISAMIASSIHDMTDRKTLSIVFALVGAIAMFWVIEADGIWQFCVFAFLFAPIWGVISLYAFYLTPDLWTSPDTGNRLLIIAMVWCLGGAGGAYLGGYIFDHLDGYQFAFFIGALAVILAAVVIWNLRIPESQTSKSPAGGTDDGTCSEL